MIQDQLRQIQAPILNQSLKSQKMFIVDKKTKTLLNVTEFQRCQIGQARLQHTLLDNLCNQK